jgi:hypothetical protein
VGVVVVVGARAVLGRAMRPCGRSMVSREEEQYRRLSDNSRDTAVSGRRGASVRRFPTPLLVK